MSRTSTTRTIELDERVRSWEPWVIGDAQRGPRMTFRGIPSGRGRIGERRFSDARLNPQFLGQLHHEVRVPPNSRDVAGPAFWMGETPVTQEQFSVWTQGSAYREWLQSSREPHSNHSENRSSHPAERVTWFEAEEFFAWLTRHWIPKDCGWRAALPNEQWWEYACRAGTKTEFSSGDGEASLTRVACFNSSSTASVRGLQPNAWGLYDMHGNVEEWCSNAWEVAGYRPLAPSAAGGSTERKENGCIVRGGSWENSARGCRSAYRSWWKPSNRFRYLGFRVCLFPGFRDLQRREADPE